MADEITETPVPVVEDATPAPVVEQATEPESPHPLDPGGQRFGEVYRDMQEARREAARLQGELDKVRQPARPAEPQFYSPNDLQGLVDSGRITPAVMTAQIAWQERQIAKQEMRQEWTQHEQMKGAGAEVTQYMAAIPKLGDAMSDERRRVDSMVREIAAEMNTTMDDPRAQRRALQIAFGTLDKVTKPKVTMTQAESYVETAGGGGVKKPATSGDPLKDVPAAYKTHWEKMGYTRDQMVEEAKYIRPTPRQRAGLWKP